MNYKNLCFKEYGDNNYLCMYNALCKIHDVIMIITSYEAWEVMDIVYVLQTNEVKPGSIFKGKKKKKNMIVPQNPTMAHNKITKLSMEFGHD